LASSSFFPEDLAIQFALFPIEDSMEVTCRRLLSGTFASIGGEGYIA